MSSATAERLEIPSGSAAQTIVLVHPAAQRAVRPGGQAAGYIFISTGGSFAGPEHARPDFSAPDVPIDFAEIEGFIE